MSKADGDEVAALKARLAVLEGKKRSPSGCGVLLIVIGTLTIFGAVMSSVFGDKPKDVAVAPESQQPTFTRYEAREMVKARLKDPDSAKFGELFQPNDETVCGTVSARNGFGGYTGQRHFIANPLIVTLEEDTTASKFVKMWNANCGSGATG